MTRKSEYQAHAVVCNQLQLSPNSTNTASSRRVWSVTSKCWRLPLGFTSTKNPRLRKFLITLDQMLNRNLNNSRNYLTVMIMKKKEKRKTPKMNNKQHR